MALTVLFIEDDAIEVMKLHRTIKKLNVNHKIVEAENGEEALKILKEKRIIPDIILLDLNMPKMNGVEFLKILKEDEVLRYIPSIVLSTSNNRHDVMECYQTGIAGYILKPLKYEEYVEKIGKTLEYWNTNELIKTS